MATVRPDSWNLPLLMHVGGAMLLVGALVTVAALLLAARRADSAPLLRLAFRTLLYAGIPAYLLMRVGAELVASKENLNEDPAWLGIGYITSDLGGVLIITTTVVAGLGARRMARDGGTGRSRSIAAGLTLVVLAAYVVAIWAMTTKPG